MIIRALFSPEGDGGGAAAAVAPAAAPILAPVPAAAIAPGATPSPPPKPGSAKARMFGDLQKFADSKAVAKPSAATAPTASTAAEDPPATTETSRPGDTTPPTAPDKKKANPWKLLDEHKARTAALEKELSEIRGKVPSEDRQKEIDRITSRAKELEDEIRYTNYTKSEEFKTKYEQPYNQAWKRAMTDLSELTITSADGTNRPINASDVLDVVNLPIQEARKLAVERFGDFADDVMSHRKEIRRLFDEQQNAVENARKEGEVRDKTRAEQRRVEQETFAKDITETWTKANEAAKSDEKYGKYFTAVEGDQEGNQRLAKGFELADRAFSEHPAKAKTPDERKAIVERHAAVRNRAAAFGRLVFQNTKLDARVKELEVELKKYTGTEPPTSGSHSAPSQSGSGRQSAWDSVRAGLQKIAK